MMRCKNSFIIDTHVLMVTKANPDNIQYAKDNLEYGCFSSPCSDHWVSYVHTERVQEMINHGWKVPNLHVYNSCFEPGYYDRYYGEIQKGAEIR